MDEAVARRELVASRLRVAREAAGLSQGQVARLMGCHRPTISEMEAGRRRVAVEELTQLAELYAVDVAWLAGGDETQPDAERDRMLLAARELSRLKPEDLDRVVQLLAALRKDKERGT